MSGWLVLRVDDSTGTLDEQLCRVVRTVRGDADYAALVRAGGHHVTT